jgi:phosphoglycolate phosphatase-like HAD superfamily hydrolase
LLREAAALEVSGYFEAIHAPEPSLPEYSKEWLVLSVLEWQHLDPGQLLTIGDGQVEIAVTKKHGGFAMGVASSEKRDGCFNREKLKMLVNAGADMVVPDFRNHRVLTGCLFDGVL